MTEEIVTLFDLADRPQGRRCVMCWDDVCTYLLSRPCEAPDANSIPGWSPVEFEGDYRMKSRIRRVFAVGVDIDGGATLAEAREAYVDCWGYIHSTRKSRPDALRLRVVLPLAEPMTDVHDVERVVRRMQRRAPGQVDTGTGDASRLWFRPWAGSAHFVHAGLVGEPLDGHRIAQEEREREEQEAAERRAIRFVPPPVTDGSYAERALSRACHAVESAAEGERHERLAREAWNIGQLVGAGLLSQAHAESALDAASARVFPENRSRERVRTLAQQLAEGAKHPREIRRSPWG